MTAREAAILAFFVIWGIVLFILATRALEWFTLKGREVGWW